MCPEEKQVRPAQPEDNQGLPPGVEVARLTPAQIRRLVSRVRLIGWMPGSRKPPGRFIK